MSIDTKKINDVLKGFATILQSYRPNVQELELIQAKIDSMVEKNRKNMHQTTEYLMIGRLITPTSASTAVARPALARFSIALRSAIIPTYKKNNKNWQYT